MPVVCVESLLANAKARVCWPLFGGAQIGAEVLLPAVRVY